MLTLWATVVAERSCYPNPTALTLGCAVAGYSTQAKARRLGLVEEREHGEEQPERGKPVEMVQLLGRQIPVMHLPDGSLRAVEHGKAASDRAVFNYLQRAFGERLGDVGAAMETLANAFSSDELNRVGFHL